MRMEPQSAAHTPHKCSAPVAAEGAGAKSTSLHMLLYIFAAAAATRLLDEQR